MSFDSDMRKRQQRRRQEQKRRQEQQRRLRLRLIFGLIGAVVLVALCILVVLLVQNAPPSDSLDSTQPGTSQATQPIQTQPTEPETVINLAFGGDLNVTNKVVSAGNTTDGYDYTGVLMDVVPVLAGADAAVLNFEGNLCGIPYGTAKRSAPPQLMEALSDAGVDLIQMANSCAIDNGLLGLSDTLDGIREHGMEPVGAYASVEDFERSGGFTLRNINGLKVAFVAFTKGVNNLGLPEGNEDCVNLLYTDYTSTYQDVDTEGITKILRAVAQEEPDVTIALLHWGSEYNNQISSSQEKITTLMQEEGVDAIIGTHSHYVQQVDYDQQTGSLVAYSLGDFFGDADKNNTNYSIILELEITKNNQTGETKITEFDYTPIYTMTPIKDKVASTKIIRIEEAIAAYEANNISKVSPETYEALKTALSRINSRVEPKE